MRMFASPSAASNTIRARLGQVGFDCRKARPLLQEVLFAFGQSKCRSRRSRHTQISQTLNNSGTNATRHSYRKAPTQKTPGSLRSTITTRPVFQRFSGRDSPAKTFL